MHGRPDLHPIQGQCEIISGILMTRSIWCLVSLMMAPYTRAETCFIKTLQHKNSCYDCRLLSLQREVPTKNINFQSIIIIIIIIIIQP
jgi:hypothetical protein